MLSFVHCKNIDVKMKICENIRKSIYYLKCTKDVKKLIYLVLFIENKCCDL